MSFHFRFWIADFGLAAVLAHGVCNAADGVSPLFLDAVRQVESAGGKRLSGDGVKALGPFQFWECAWNETMAYRAGHGLETWEYLPNCMNEERSRAAAESRFTMLREWLVAKLHREPTLGELYAAWNCGRTSFARKGLSLRRCPTVTRIRAEQIQQEAGR